MLYLLIFACLPNQNATEYSEQALSTSVPLSGGSDGETQFYANVCDAAIDHWNACSGEALTKIECSEQAGKESELILDLDCPTLTQAAPALPLCETLGWCESSTACGDPLDIDDVTRLLEYSDRSTVEGASDVLSRIEGIARVFADKNDLRGTFSTVYEPITERAVEGIHDGTYEHDVWAEDLMIEFSGRYFDNLRLHLLNQDPSREWQRYYDLSMDCSVSPLRVAASGISVHLIVDLPYTLETIESEAWHKADFERYGLELVDANPKVIENLKYNYDIDGTDFFSGFFIGDWVDGVFGQNTLTTFSFQRIRAKAWTNGQWLQGWEAWIAEQEIAASWKGADDILLLMDASGSI